MQGFFHSGHAVRGNELLTVVAGGVSVKTTPGHTSGALWQSGALHRFIPRRAVQAGNGVRVEFDPSPAGKLEALWTLPADAASASVTLTYVPAMDVQVALSYESFFRGGIESVSKSSWAAAPPPIHLRPARLPQQFGDESDRFRPEHDRPDHG